MSSPTKSRRRTKAEIDAIREAIYDLLSEENPMTVRQVFYRLVSSGHIHKTEGEYKSTVCRLLTEMRRSGAVDYGWIADNTRWMRKPHTYDSMSDMLQQTSRTYRRAPWNSQEAYVEIWLEKEALAGVLWDVTEPWDVPLMVTRGYPSLSFIYEAAEALDEQAWPCFLYYFGDLDPSGMDISRSVEEQLRELAPSADITFERVAVTREQVEAMKLPTRPTKKSDSRARNFKGDSVEVDAISPRNLRAIAEQCITRHIDEEALARTRRIEAAERQTLHEVAAKWQGVA